MSKKTPKTYKAPCGSFTCNQIDKCGECANGIRRPLPDKENKNE